MNNSGFVRRYSQIQYNYGYEVNARSGSVFVRGNTAGFDVESTEVNTALHTKRVIRGASLACKTHVISIQPNEL